MADTDFFLPSQYVQQIAGQMTRMGVRLPDWLLQLQRPGLNGELFRLFRREEKGPTCFLHYGVSAASIHQVIQHTPIVDGIPSKEDQPPICPV